MATMNEVLIEIGAAEQKQLAFQKDRNDNIAEKEQLMETAQGHKDALETVKQKKTDIQKSIDALNLSVAEHDEKLKELESKRMYILSGGGKNADLEILKKQVAEEKADRSVLEDKVLSMMEQIEQTDTKIKEAGEKLNSFQAEIDIKAAEIDKKVKTIDADIDAITGEINKYAEALKSANSDAHSFYLRLQEKGVRPAIVRVTGENCQGCYFTLSPDVLNKIYEGNALIKCPNCYRILFAEDFEDEEEDE